MLQVCQADHNIVFTALGEERLDYGQRDAEVDWGSSLSLSATRVSQE